MIHLLLAAIATMGQPVAGSPIAHIIVIVQENRTFDNLFASSILANGAPYPGADAKQTANIDGKRIRMRSVPFEYPADPDHAHAALVAEWNNGKMDGFPKDKIYPNDGFPAPAATFPLAYVPDYETIVYHLLAQRYALADRNFSPRLTPTFPAHVFLVAAQSAPSDDPTDPVNWGCDSAKGTTVPVFDPAAGPEAITTPGIFPCFGYRTIGDLLDRAHVSWKYYTGAIGNVADAQVNVFDAMKLIRYSPDWTSNVSTPMSNVLGDIQNCRLPQVSYVTPTWLNSDHAGSLSNGGPGWVGSIYLAIEQSQHSANPACRYYDDTATILTWDDSGGWYDHVAPPPGPDGTSWGFRLPIVAISAYARSNYTPKGPFTPYVSHTQRESTAIVRFIEKNFGLGNLGQRDASGDDLHDLFDYARKAPVPPVSEPLLGALIRHTDWDLARSLHDTHPVDDDR